MPHSPCENSATTPVTDSFRTKKVTLQPCLLQVYLPKTIAALFECILAPLNYSTTNSLSMRFIYNVFNGQALARCLIALGFLLLSTSYATPFNEHENTLDNPLLFALVVPPFNTNGTFGHQLETFGNHLTGMQEAPRGGDLCLMDVNGNVRFLTREAGFGVESGEVQAENAIAVRQPCVHWDGNKALFSMVVGGPVREYDQSYRQNKWQIYEITNLGEVINGATPVIQRVPGQPENYNNISPIYGSDDQVIFTSDAPLFGMHYTYPQRDEYESSPTNTGIFKLNPATGTVVHLTHSPSGDFDIHLAKDGRIISTRWEHLKRDQQADAHRAGEVPWAPVNYESERSNAGIISGPAMLNGKPYADADGTPYEVFPEARVENDPTRDPNEPLHDFNEFLPWEITENGERHQTVNHVGRHEFGGVYQNGSKLDDPNLTYILGNFTKNSYRETVRSDAGIFQIKEDPRPGKEGTFYGTWAKEFKRLASGRIFEFSLPIGANPQDMEIVDWSHPDIDRADNNKGHFRNPIMLMNGTMVVSHATESEIFDREHPYNFRLAKMVKASADASDTEHIPGERLTGDGFERTIVYWGDAGTPFSVDVIMGEVDVVEVTPRSRPEARPEYEVNEIEREVIEEEGVDVLELQNWMIENNLALIAIRNITERDQGENQQPFNLRVPGGVSTTPKPGKVYDISHFQLFGAEMLRAYEFRDLVGRRVIATPLRNTEHNNNVEQVNLLDREGPDGSVKISPDGSVAAFVPATRAMSWQTVAPDGEPIVRERQWLTFAPGEIRTCEGCHGINSKSHAGNFAPQNKPEALRELMRAWKNGPTVPTGIDDRKAVSSDGLTLYQNYPNPFEGSTTISYALPQNGHVRIVIYNATGQAVKTIVDHVQTKGKHVIAWDGTDAQGRNLGTGLFICRLEAGNRVVSNKVFIGR